MSAHTTFSYNQSMLLQSADGVSIVISRLTGLMIALFSLIIGIINLAKNT